MLEKPSYKNQQFAILISLLRDRQAFLEEISQGIRLQSKTSALFVSSSICFAIYGAIIGASHSWGQALSSAIKLPAFYLLTLIICFPTLFFFNVLFGSRSSFQQHFVVLLTAVSVISVLLFSLAPVTLFFMITAPNSYQFFKLLNVLIFGITGIFGIKFLYEGMQLLSKQDEVGKKTRTTILRSWLFLYGFVGVQLGWFLRPFFGAPGSKFELFRAVSGNFYLDIVAAISEILGAR
ncbi:actin-binding WH2 domain-containing protein [Calothrix sp. FACHB-1219]|uniref:actin-binding WH2 domain-containing protein n=1 Tax=unclassified Calothrix TaxID=2619626 RepID=UPI001686D807|nr:MULTISPECIES: actin-binding WH2 domain-containing protein [unclassified Calothrix]MBD2203220.1 actin-binding WH2 domain-containing protein [Calothrix sp. FACHB-168]MBD2216484.1 actin-binding WH2 domain-containing protein [Calothrix sp. FACHB-1219]